MFVIRKDLLADFEEVIGKIVKDKIDVEYAYQEIGDVPNQYWVPAEKRTKPWGTGQAILAVKSVIDTPFLVINADDYYGKEANRVTHEYLCAEEDNCMIGAY